MSDKPFLYVMSRNVVCLNVITLLITLQIPMWSRAHSIIEADLENLSELQGRLSLNINIMLLGRLSLNIITRVTDKICAGDSTMPCRQSIQVIIPLSSFCFFLTSNVPVVNKFASHNRHRSTHLMGYRKCIDVTFTEKIKVLKAH